MVLVNSIHGLPMWHFNGKVIISGNVKVKIYCKFMKNVLKFEDFCSYQCH